MCFIVLQLLFLTLQLMHEEHALVIMDPLHIVGSGYSLFYTVILYHDRIQFMDGNIGCAANVLQNINGT